MEGPTNWDQQQGPSEDMLIRIWKRQRNSKPLFATKLKDMDVDHYSVLGLPSGEEGAKLSEKEISKAYRAKVLVFHPDKSPNDVDALDNCQRLNLSYEILKDEKKRKLFDDHLRVKREKELRHSKQDSKRRKMVSDLEERERAASPPDPTARARDEGEKITMRKLQEEIATVCARHANKGASTTSTSKQETTGGKEANGGGGGALDREKVLRVSWEKVGDDYTAERLRELFSKFGDVEDVVIESSKKRSSKKRGSALVEMANKEAAVSGYLLNPLLVLPLQPVVATEFPHAQRPIEPDRKLVGAGHQEYEDEVINKLLEVAAKQQAESMCGSFKGCGSQNAEKLFAYPIQQAFHS